MSYYTSLTGLKNAQTSLNVVSHNISNAETNGFKKSTTSFADIVSSSVSSDPSQTVGSGSRVSAVTQDYSLGSIEQTGSALDVAIDGEGFFTVVSQPSGETQYTRNGAFSLDADGYLKSEGDANLQSFAVSGGTVGTTLQDTQVPLTNSSGSAFSSVTINSNGEVVASYEDGTNETVGVVALATFISPSGLKQQGSSTWTATGKSGAASYGQPDTGKNGALMSGSLERSNVDISEELVALISAQRYFQANAKAIDTASQISETIINLRT